MAEMGKDKLAALEAIRRQLGCRVTSGMELLQKQQQREPSASAGLEGLNAQLGGGFRRGQLTEIVGGRVGGGGLVMAAMLARARRERRYVVLLDAGGGFCPGSFPPSDLETLLWVGCRSPVEAVEALDIVSRDENFDLFLLDFREAAAHEWRGVRPKQWYRILGQLRQREAAEVIFADEPVTTVAKCRLRVELATATSLALPEVPRGELWEVLRVGPLEVEEREGGGAEVRRAG